MNENNDIAMKNRKIASDSMKKFEKYVAEGNIGRACAHMLVALKLEPTLKSKLVEVFAASLRQWGHVLAKRKEYGTLFQGYEQALQVYPNNVYVINDFGAFLYKYGDLSRACVQFKKACSMLPDNIESERNLQMCLSAMVDRWHFRMLNDNHRNEAYREAITKKIKQGFTRVLDIGTGSGFLSLIAARVCAETIFGGTVFACESSPTMCTIAKAVFKENVYDSQIENIYFLNKHSTSLTLASLADESVSLVVTEIMDAGLFGEGILETLIHAWQHLLFPPLPRSSESLCMICTDKDLSPHQRGIPRVNGFVVPFGATVWLTAIECPLIARKHRSSRKRCHNLDTPFIFQAISTEPYDTENLQSLADGFKLLCEPIKCFFVNFNKPKQLSNFFEGKFDDDIHKLEFTTEGTLDAFVVWFDLHVDEDIKISTSPFSENASTCCWDQAIFPYKKELRVVPGCTAKLKVKTKQGSLRVEVSEIDDHITNSSNYEEIPVSQEFVRFFNNSELLDILSIYSQAATQCDRILDYSPFPFLGLMLLNASENTKLSFVAKCSEDIHAVDTVALHNGIPFDRISSYLESSVTVEDLSSGSPYNLIITDLINPGGELSETSIDHLSLSKSFLAAHGVILPQYLNIWGQVISSEWVKRSAEVLTEGIVDTFRIPRYMNAFKVKHQVDINSQTLSHIALSEPSLLGIISVLDIAFHEKRSLKRKITVTQPGTATGLLQWFQYEIRLPNCGTLQYSTRNIESHVNQMCVLMENRILTTDQLVGVSCKYYLGGFVFKFKYK